MAGEIDPVTLAHAMEIAAARAGAAPPRGRSPGPDPRSVAAATLVVAEYARLRAVAEAPPEPDEEVTAEA